MNKKIVGGLAIGAILIILAAVLYYLSTGSPPKTGPSAVTAPGPAPATAPPAPQLPPAAGPIEPAGPPKGAAPSPEPKVTVLPPLKGQEKHGILAGTYKKYPAAAKMLARLKKQGQPAFIQRDPHDLSRYQVWLGPFASRGEAEAAEKSLRAFLKKPLKIETIENPVPK
jgi:cell division septation protein DedD